MMHVPTPAALATAHPLAPVAHAIPLPFRAPAVRLVHAREDHARCLALAAAYRVRLSRGDLAMRGMHEWALRHARTLRLRFPGRLSAA